jgi:hypothetical protein
MSFLNLSGYMLACLIDFLFTCFVLMPKLNASFGIE